MSYAITGKQAIQEFVAYCKHANKKRQNKVTVMEIVYTILYIYKCVFLQSFTAVAKVP